MEEVQENVSDAFLLLPEEPFFSYRDFSLVHTVSLALIIPSLLD